MAMCSVRAGLIACAVLAFPSASPAYAMTTTQCHDKFNAAKAAGALNGLKWAEFKKTQCADAATTLQKPATETAAKVKPLASPNSAAIFPSTVASKYATESAGRARMHTCRDQYQANKASNGNGGLRWIEKGGGYYSECNKHLKS